jgi:hypothetical protein
MDDLAAIEGMLLQAFPRLIVEGAIAPHGCVECDAIRKQLTDITWVKVPADFIRANDGSLPLLSHEAYVAFLPAWLRLAVREPDGPSASMLLVNLRHAPNTRGFTPPQAAAIIEVVRYITNHNGFGPNDPVNMESLASVRQLWSPLAR